MDDWRTNNARYWESETTPVAVPLDFKEPEPVRSLFDSLIKTMETKICYLCSAFKTQYMLPVAQVPICTNCVTRIVHES